MRTYLSLRKSVESARGSASRRSPPHRRPPLVRGHRPPHGRLLPRGARRRHRPERLQRAPRGAGRGPHRRRRRRARRTRRGRSNTSARMPNINKVRKVNYAAGSRAAIVSTCAPDYKFSTNGRLIVLHSASARARRRRLSQSIGRPVREQHVHPLRFFTKRRVSADSSDSCGH